MSISDPVDVTRAEANTTTEREARLTPGVAAVAIFVMAALCWSVVVMAIIGLRSVL